jgi:formylglycine-generating enzyme required for sulfatase activity
MEGLLAALAPPRRRRRVAIAALTGAVAAGAIAAALLVSRVAAPWTACAQNVTNVRAGMTGDGLRVEVLYDLSGAGGGGASVSVEFSSDDGATFAIVPAAGSLSGHVGQGVTNGTDRRIVWDGSTQGVTSCPPVFRARVTAQNPPGCEGPLTVTLPGGVPLQLVCVKGGTFVMGAPPDERGRFAADTQHTVTITRDFYMGKYEITQRQWRAITGTNPAVETGCGLDCAVERVSWNDIAGAGGFLEKLNQQQSTTKFRLPTEAEWEYAARAGTATPFWFGDDAACSMTDCLQLCVPSLIDQNMWWCGNNSARASKPVGQKPANPWGLHDMHGSVFEWVQDWLGAYTDAPAVDPQGPATGTSRVIRGGAFNTPLQVCRSAARAGGPVTARDGNYGLRVVRTAP